MASGIVPENRFIPISNKFNDVKAEIEDEIVPVKAFMMQENPFRFAMLVIAEKGKLPESLFDPKSKY